VDTKAPSFKFTRRQLSKNHTFLTMLMHTMWKPTKDYCWNYSSNVSEFITTLRTPPGSKNHSVARQCLQCCKITNRITNLYQPWHLPPSPQDPAGLPSHLAPSCCVSDSALVDHCARLQIIFTYLLTYLRDSQLARPDVAHLDGRVASRRRRAVWIGC